MTAFLRSNPDQAMQFTVESGGEENNQTEESVTRSFSLNEAIKTPQFWIVFCLLFCFGFGTFAVTVHIVPHATDLQISIVSASNILAVRGATSIMGNYILGTLADRIGNRQIFIIGFAMISAVLFLLSSAEALWILYICIAIFGFAGGGMGPSESPLTAWLFGTGSHGLVYGVVHVGFTIGAAAGPYIMGAIYDKTGSYQPAFLTCAVLTVIGFILSLLLKPTGKPAVKA
ncbi:MAG: MFS transporter [Dehalococcoidia bacterium]